MNLHQSLCEKLPLNELPNQVARNLVSKLNENDRWIEIIEKINPFMDRKLNIGEYRMYESPSEKLIDELANRKYTVNVLALLLQDMELFEPLSTILQPESITVADWIGDRTNCTRVELGGTLVITCTALGNPIPSIVWWKDNLPVEEQAALRHDIQIRVENCSTISTLKVFEMCPEYQGKYFCVVESTDPDIAKIYTKELDVSIEMCRPKIIEQPTNQCRIETQPIILTCKASGYPSVEYQWYHNNKKIFDQLDSTLRINSCTKEQSGNYKCVVTNSAGMAESDVAILTISSRNLLRVEQNKRLEAVEKVAMLIGNADEVLKKPINDILLLAQKLTSVGFKVIPLINLGAEDMLKALEMFSNLLEKDVYALFYFAGHGCQDGNEAVIPLTGHEDGLTYYFTQSFIKQQLLQKNPKIRIVILDMCLKNFAGPVHKRYTGIEDSKPDINYLVACSTSSNLPSYESKNQPNGAYMTELSKYISPECNYTIQSIIAEVNRAISEREAKIENIEERQIPKCDNNFYEEFTFLDTVTGHTQIKHVINSISTPPEDMKVEFKNVDGSLLKARIKFFPYKQFILNSLLMVVCDLNVEGCKIRIDTERDVIGMENMVKPTDVWNKFEICNLQRLRAGINLSLFSMEKEGKILATAEIFVPEALVCKALG